MVAVFIFAGSILFVLPFLQKSENQLKKNLRKLQALNQNLYTRSRIENRAYRIAIQTQTQKSSYWVEVKKPPSDTEEIEESKEETQESNLALKDKAPEHPFFKKDTSFFETQNFPEGFYLESSESEQETEQNIIYITYDPHRFSKSVKLFLRKGEAPPSWTLFFNSLSGELELLRKT